MARSLSSADGEAPLIEARGHPAAPDSRPSRKRKSPDGELQPSTKPNKLLRKRGKKRKHVTGATLQEQEFNEQLGLNLATGRMDSGGLAELVARKTKTALGRELSGLEIVDLAVSAASIHDTTVWDHPRTLDSLPAFLEHFSGGEDLKTASEKAGCPHTLVIAGAGLRAADLTRALRKFQSKDAHVSKLFAKHIKLREAVQACQRTRMTIGVGTPQRIADLLEEGALETTQLRRVVVDASHVDVKRRGVLDMRETLAPLVRLLARDALREGFVAGTRLLFY